MSAPLSRVYPERIEVSRRSGLLQVIPAVIVVSLLGIAGVGFAWSSAARTRHAERENYAALEKRLVQTEETNAQLRGQLSVVAVTSATHSRRGSRGSTYSRPSPWNGRAGNSEARCGIARRT